MINLYQSLASLNKVKTAPGSYTGKNVRGYGGNVILCIDQFKNPLILLQNSRLVNNPPPTTQLENIEISHNNDCTVDIKNKKKKGYFSIIKLTSLDNQLRSTFLEIIEATIGNLQFPSSSQDIDLNLQAIINLFRSMNQSSVKKASGLWSELFIIDSSKNLDKIIGYWHDLNNDTYDFSLGNNYLEVKSTLGSERKHILSIDQAYPDPKDNVVFASLMLEESSLGLSLGDLRARIRNRIKDPSLKLKFDGLYYSCLGNTWKEASLRSFDESHAKQNIKYLDLKDIPKIDSNQKNISGVSGIKFTSNFDMSSKINKTKFKKKSLLFKITLV